MLGSKAKSHRPISFLLVGAPILAFVLIAVGSVRQKSPTYDELIHLFAGYSYLKWGDFRANPEHPPLAKALAALPLLALDLEDPRQSNAYWDLIPKGSDYGWVLAHRMIYLQNDAERLFFLAKLPLLALSALLGLFVYRWAKDLYGVEAGLAAAFIYFLDPNILGHGPIIHTDVPFSAIFFIGTYFFYRALGRLTWVNLIMTWISFGLVAVTKFSFWTVVPIWTSIGLAKVFSSEPVTCSLGGEREVYRRWGKAGLITTTILIALVWAYFFIWAAYGLRFDAVATGDGPHLPMAQVMPQALLVQEMVSLSLRHKLFPEAWIYGLLYVGRHLMRPAYLLGQVSGDGFWSYFPIAFLVKTPLPTLLLLCATLGLWISTRKVSLGESILLICSIIYFSFAIWSRLNIGLRHILPVYPFLFVLAGGATAKMWSTGKRSVKYGLLVLALWYLWSAIHTYPHYLSYFNEMIGGPKNGFKVLTDSSLDWGQDLKGLKYWMDRNEVKKIQLAYFGTADPSYYGIDAVYLPGSIIFSPRPASANPETPEYLAVSVTYVYGVHSGRPLQGRYLPLRRGKPIATIGHSIFIYKVTQN